MAFTLALTAITGLPLLVAAASQRIELAVTAIPLFKHSSLGSADKSVNFEALNARVASTTAKIRRGFDNFEKNTGSSHPSAVKGAWKRASGGLPLDYLPDDVDYWFGTISVGTPPESYLVLFDTGSSDFFLPGVECDYSCDGHKRYDPASSPTSADLDMPFHIQYEDGDSAFGQQYTDNVTIVGLTATDQALGVALHCSDGLRVDRFPADGMVGMAFQSISQYNQSPVFQTLVTQGQTNEPIFAFRLAAPRPELHLGGTNPDMYIGDFTYVPVTQPAYWQINAENVVGNGQIVLTDVACDIDTGTNLIHGHPAEVAALYKAIGGAFTPTDEHFYSFPCDAVPIISFTFGGRSFPIPVETLNIGEDPDDPSYCVGAIIPGDLDVTSWVVGTVFLSSVYTAFDFANQRVGFATLA
ncbi:acid protease [Gyrodon lividus]|nr:acid protease [Gyrodon lividus]